MILFSFFSFVPFLRFKFFKMSSCFSEHKKTAFSYFSVHCPCIMRKVFLCIVPNKRLWGYLVIEIMQRKLCLKNLFEENNKAIKRCLSFAVISYYCKPIS